VFVFSWHAEVDASQVAGAGTAGAAAGAGPAAALRQHTCSRNVSFSTRNHLRTNRFLGKKNRKYFGSTLCE